MPKVIKLAEFLRENPDFRPNFQILEETLPDGTRLVTGIEHPKLGKIVRVVLCGDDGIPIYDSCQIEEGPADAEGKRAPSSGAVIVPYFTSNEVYVGLLERVREFVIDPATMKQGNYRVHELPRGFGRLVEMGVETAVRELGEETSKVARKLEKIGRVNPNTAFYVTPGVGVYAAEVDQTVISRLRPDSNEPILRCTFFPYGDVRRKIADQEIFCGFSLSGLMLFDAYLERSGLR